MAKKFVEGMECCRQHLPNLDLTQFNGPFANGDFDDVIWSSSKPALTGRFWPWVKDACAAAEAAAAAQAELALKMEAEEAGRAAEQAFREAELESESAAQQAEASNKTVQEARKAASLSVLGKLREAHCKTLQLHCQKTAAKLQVAWKSAEEAAIRRHERSEAEVECRGILELKGVKSKSPSVPWARQLPALPRVVVIDTDLYAVEKGMETLKEDAEAAVDLIGDKGCLIIVTFAPSFAESGRALAAEQGANGKTVPRIAPIGVARKGPGWVLLTRRPWWLACQGISF